MRVRCLTKSHTHLQTPGTAATVEALECLKGFGRLKAAHTRQWSGLCRRMRHGGRGRRIDEMHRVTRAVSFQTRGRLKDVIDESRIFEISFLELGWLLPYCPVYGVSPSATSSMSRESVQPGRQAGRQQASEPSRKKLVSLSPTPTPPRWRDTVDLVVRLGTRMTPYGQNRRKLLGLTEAAFSGFVFQDLLS